MPFEDKKVIPLQLFEINTMNEDVLSSLIYKCVCVILIYDKTSYSSFLKVQKILSIISSAISSIRSIRSLKNPMCVHLLCDRKRSFAEIMLDDVVKGFGGCGCDHKLDNRFHRASLSFQI